MDRRALPLQKEGLMLLHFVYALVALAILDGLWLGVLMSDF